jgi:hypothetical protein
MTTGQKVALIVAGFVALAGGIGYLMFRSSKKEEKLDVEGNVIEDGSGGGLFGGLFSKEDEKDKKPLSADEVLDEKIKKDSKGEGAKAVQTIINQIAAWRGWRDTTKTVNGVNVKFPIKADGDFGKKSDAAARLIFDSYAKSGFITRHKARLKWAYSAGYYKNNIPEQLKDSSRKDEYYDEHIKGSKASK